MSETLNSGTVVGPYIIERLIGKGGMGEVYLASEARLRRFVALKTISPELAKDAETLKRFQSEGRTLALISHPNVVSIYAIDQVANLHYIAMEFIDGRSLSDICKNILWPAEEAAPLFVQMLEGLQALHSKNVIHRDLKPANIIYQKESLIKIIDLGVAKSFDDTSVHATVQGMVVGTLKYMAPEIAVGRPASPSSDIFGMGSIFFEMLTGSGLIQANNQVQALSQLSNLQINFTREMSASIPPEMQTIIRKMCAKDFQERYRSATEALVDMKAFIAKYPDHGKWAYSMCARNITNFAVVRQQLLQRGENEYAIKRILFQSQIENVRVRSNLSTTPADPNKTALLAPVDNEELIPASVNTAMTQLIKVSAASRKSKIFTPMRAALGVGTLALLAGGLWYAKFRTGAHGQAKPLAAETATTVPQVEVAPIAETRTPAAAPAPAAPAPNAAAPVPILSKNAVTEVLTPKGIGALTWSAAGEKAQYEIQLSSNNSFQDPIVTQIVTKPEYTWAGVRPGEFFWRVRTFNGYHQSAYSAVATLKVLVPPPEMAAEFQFPIKIGTDGRIDSHQAPVQIEWERADTAEGYRLLIASDPEFKTILETRVTRGPSAAITPKGPETLHVKVAALDSMKREISAYTLGSSVVLNDVAAAGVPVPVSPADGKTFSFRYKPTSVLMYWRPVAKAPKYEVQLSQNTAFTRVIFSKVGVANQVLIQTKLPEGNLYWRTRVVSAKGNSLWSQTRKFTIDNTRDE